MNTDPSTFTCEIRWQGENADYDTFPRLHQITLPGGQSVKSGAGHNVQDAKQTNPEELFAAALGSCMLQTVLAVFSKAQIRITAYEDKPEALLEFIERRFRVTKLTLRPRITIEGPIEPEKLANLISKSHANCFIAVSVKSEVIVEPTFVNAV